MNTVYEIEVVHADRSHWVDELRREVANELLELGVHRSLAINVVTDPADPEVPAVLVMLGSEAGASDPAVASRIKEAAAAGLVVFPVVSDLQRFSDECPPSIRNLNGLAFNARLVARAALQELGILERELGVFLSHKRDDGLWAAEQLHDELSHRSFRPFIDRFAIRPAGEVQAEIADALEQHAFLLLLETPLAHTSPWVFDEVDYALVRTMAFLIISWPGDPAPVPGSLGLPRLKLEPDEIVVNQHGAEELSDAALDRVVAAVEAAHARGLVRRRRQLLRSVEDAAVAAGARATPLPRWRLLVEHDEERVVVGVAPRLPSSQDLQDLDIARGAFRGAEKALLVHAARQLRHEREQHLNWVLGERSLKLLPENAVGAQWR